MRPKVENKMEEYRDKGILVPQALPHNSFVEDYKGEKVVMVHFDAMRYDYFEQMYDEYFNGKLWKCYNGGVKFTHDWFSMHCQQEMNCTLYTASAVNIADWVNIHGSYDTKKWFRNIYGMEAEDYSEELEICLPEQINEYVQKYPDDTYHYFVRYLKPHPPLVHPDLHLPWTAGETKWNVEERIQRGETSVEEIVEGYRLNCELAFEGAVELYEDMGEPDNFFITADHGTALGEAGYWWHSRQYPPLECLTVVPWFEVKGVE